MAHLEHAKNVINNLEEKIRDIINKQIHPYNPQHDVAVMMKLYEQEVKEKPELPDEDTLLLRANLILEETVETIVAMGFSVEVNKEGTLYASDEYVDHKPDLVKIADGIGDILVVTYGAANACGINAYKVFDEINRSNMTKVHPDGTIHKREDGKVIKPDTYTPANIKLVLEQLSQED